MAERHFPLERLAKALRADGVFAQVLDDAQGKSARNFAAVGYYRGCQAVVQHHSVSSGLYPQNDIAYIDGGKGDGYIISNAYTSRTGVVTLIASGPTYTEGLGGPYGIIPQNRANDVCFSNEIASWGEYDSQYPQAQQDAVEAFAYHAGRIAAEVWQWPDDPFGRYRAFAHFEWAPGRKIDPRGVSRWSPEGGMWDMDAFRSDLSARDDSTGDDMARINGFFIRVRGTADHFLCIPQTGDSKARLEPDEPAPLVLDGDTRRLEQLAGYPLTPMPGE